MQAYFRIRYGTRGVDIIAFIIGVVCVLCAGTLDIWHDDNRRNGTVRLIMNPAGIPGFVGCLMALTRRRRSK